MRRAPSLTDSLAAGLVALTLALVRGAKPLLRVLVRGVGAVPVSISVGRLDREC